MSRTLVKVLVERQRLHDTIVSLFLLADVLTPVRLLPASTKGSTPQPPLTVNSISEPASPTDGSRLVEQ